MSSAPPIQPVERPSRAVFLSYASQDAEAARRIAEALRAEGTEVWLDESELRGGDAWDASIRRQIQECALFVPIISARSQERREGYFRLEWKLADERTRLMAEGTPFLLPVAADSVRERDALVPKSFLAVQWTWLPQGEVPPAFVVRVQRLLAAGAGGFAGRSALASGPATETAPALNYADNVVSNTGAMRRRKPQYQAQLLPWALVLLLAGSVVWFGTRPVAPCVAPAGASVPPVVLHAVIVLPADAPLAPARAFPLGLSAPSLALSPDGANLVYVALVGQSTQLYLRPMGEPKARPIPDTEGGCRPFFSPDGRWIAFLAKTKLKKISVRGGAAVTLCDAGDEVYGTAWSEDNTIYFSTAFNLMRVPITGGAAEPVTFRVQRGVVQRIMNPLPGPGRLLGSFAHGSWSISGDFRPVRMLALDTDEETLVIDHGYGARFLPTGHLVFVRGHGLFAAPFLPGESKPAGEAVPVLDGVRVDAMQAVAQFAVSDTGTLVYVAGGALDTGTPAWVDRQGHTRKLPVNAQTYGEFKLSPDGRQLAICVAGVKDNIWLFDVETGNGAPLAEPGINHSPRWTPDGRRLLFTSYRGATVGIYAKSLDGTSRAADLVYQAPTPDSYLSLYGCSPADARLLFSVRPSTAEAKRAFMVSLDGSLKLEPVSQISGSFINFSPDGQWIAFSSHESGRSEIYAQRFPNGPQIQVSFGGGEEPIWSAKGDELFFRYGDAWMVVPVALNPAFKAGAPRELFRGPFINAPGFSYDVAPDGEHLLVMMPEQMEEPATQLHVVLNWSEELKRKVGGGAALARP